MEGRGVQLEDPARTPDRDIPLTTNRVDELALATRPQIFRRMTSWSISRSSDRSATSLRSLVFSSSSCFSRRISGGVGFNELYRSGSIREVACLAHIRRKFVDVFQSEGSVIAEEAIKQIAGLYAVEKDARG